MRRLDDNQRIVVLALLGAALLQPPTEDVENVLKAIVKRASQDPPADWPQTRREIHAEMGAVALDLLDRWYRVPTA